jgi:hypothetical protein
VSNNVSWVLPVKVMIRGPRVGRGCVYKVIVAVEPPTVAVPPGMVIAIACCQCAPDEKQL